jgi:hypothetical protein
MFELQLHFANLIKFSKKRDFKNKARHPLARPTHTQCAPVTKSFITKFFYLIM